MAKDSSTSIERGGIEITKLTRDECKIVTKLLQAYTKGWICIQLGKNDVTIEDYDRNLILALLDYEDHNLSTFGYTTYPMGEINDEKCIQLKAKLE